jgi:chromosome partitioning protein
MTIIIPFANQKGGVAKTTSAITLGHGLAMRGIRTLIVDTDPQGHVAFALGLSKSDGLYRLIVDEEPLESVTIEARPNLYIVPGDKRTEKVKRYVVGLDYREAVLTDVLADSDYKAIILDMAPSLDVLHVAALMAADWILIPTKLDALAVDGVNEVLASYVEATRHGARVKGYSILPTFFDRVTRETIFQLQALVDHFKAKVWPPIPVDTKVREAAAYGKTLWEYSPNSPAITGYENNHKLVGGYSQALNRFMEVIRVRKD